MVWRCLILLLALSASGLGAAAAQDTLPETPAVAQLQPLDVSVRTLREWESFLPGAWKRVRIDRQTFDEQGNVASTSITETKTTLLDIDDEGFTLTIEANVEVAGQSLPSPAQTVWYGFNGESKNEKVTSAKIGEEELRVDGRTVTAEIFQISIEQDKLRRELQAACLKEFPFVYRLHSSLREAEGDQMRELQTTQLQVTSMNLPFNVLGEIHSTAHLRTLVQRPDSSTVTVEVHCQDVPGRVVAHWARKTDAEGRLLERSTLELLDFGLQPE